MNLKEELWMPVKSYDGFFSDYYQASSNGRVKSLERKVWDKRGYWKTFPEVILKPSANRDGYLRVHLSKDGRKEFPKVHKLVYEAFNGPVPDGMQINHINEVKTDNRLVNLNVLSPGDNANHGTRNERIAKALSKVVQQFTKDGLFVAEFPSAMEASRQTGFAHQHISGCCRGEHKQAYGCVWRYKDDISETPTSTKMPTWTQLELPFAS